MFCFLEELFLLFKLIGADATKGAFVVFGQLVAFVDVAADGAYILFHADSPLLSLLIQVRQVPVKLSWQTAT